MVLDERSRHHLHLQLESALGPDAAATLMDHLPPVGWADVATKRDLDQGFALMRSDMEGGFSLMRRDMEGGFALMRRDMEGGLGQMRSDLVSGLAAGRAELHEALRSTLVAAITVNLTATIGIVGAGFAAFKLAG